MKTTIGDLIEITDYNMKCRVFKDGWIEYEGNLIDIKFSHTNLEFHEVKKLEIDHIEHSHCKIEIIFKITI